MVAAGLLPNITKGQDSFYQQDRKMLQNDTFYNLGARQWFYHKRYLRA